jgi:AraC family transcriptional regulator of adaptative response / DNA-3-methyladenine glycosylase II
VKLDSHACSKARLSRDPRFDGKFFTAVKTTKIYCRSICPAAPSKEENVEYYFSAIQAANAGYRPCLRCRPDSAPQSSAWKGVNTTLDRAIRLINEGALQKSAIQSGSAEDLAARLGISDRYLRELFKQHLGISPKMYSLYQQCLFAKQLLHQTQLSITQVALASGFNSIRRFNDSFQKQLNLTPSQVRKNTKLRSKSIQLQLFYRTPFDWMAMQKFLQARAIPELEWCNESSYGRTFEWQGSRGSFTAEHVEKINGFLVSIEIDDVIHLKPVINNIKRILDLDVDIQLVELDLERYFSKNNPLKNGLRLPGIWHVFEAGVRAILGQQVSIKAAHNLVTTLVNELGEVGSNNERLYFPSPISVANSDLSFFRMPQSRKDCLRNLAQYFVENDRPEDPEHWISLKGIGPWTVNYAKMRGLSDPDIFLAGDVGVKKAMEKLGHKTEPAGASPWRSYLTFQLWNQL